MGKRNKSCHEPTTDLHCNTFPTSNTSYPGNYWGGGDRGHCGTELSHNNRLPTTQRPRSNLRSSVFRWAHLIPRLVTSVWSVLSSRYLVYFSALMLSLTYLSPPSPLLGWGGNLLATDSSVERAAFDSLVYHSLSGAIRSVVEAKLKR